VQAASSRTVRIVSRAISGCMGDFRRERPPL
jgi:hypothetical protein